MVLRIFGITRDYWVWALPLTGLTVGWWLDRKEIERMVSFRDRSALYGKNPPPAKPSWPSWVN
jgi:hypothetical protein